MYEGAQGYIRYIGTYRALALGLGAVEGQGLGFRLRGWALRPGAGS